MNLNFKVKEEPKEEEALSATLPRSSYVFSPESEVPAPSISEDTLKPQEAKGNVLRRDMSVKAASELLMKLSGTRFILKYSHADAITCKPTGLLPTRVIISLMAATSHYDGEFRNDWVLGLNSCVVCMSLFADDSCVPVLLHTLLVS